MDCSDAVDAVFSEHADIHSGHKLANPIQKILRDEFCEGDQDDIKYNIADCMYKTDCDYFVPPLYNEISHLLNETLLRVEMTRAFCFHTLILREYAYLSGYKYRSDRHIDSLSDMQYMLDGDSGAFKAVNKIKRMYNSHEVNIDKYKTEVTSIIYMCNRLNEHIQKACVSCYTILTDYLSEMFNREFHTMFITITCDELSFIKSKLDNLAKECNSEYIRNAISDIEMLIQQFCYEQYEVDVKLFVRVIVTIIFSKLTNLFNSKEEFNDEATSYINRSQEVYLYVACIDRRRILLAIDKLKTLI